MASASGILKDAFVDRSPHPNPPPQGGRELYQVPLNETHVGDSRIGVFVIQHGKRMEVCHGFSSSSSR